MKEIHFFHKIGMPMVDALDPKIQCVHHLHPHGFCSPHRGVHQQAGNSPCLQNTPRKDSIVCVTNFLGPPRGDEEGQPQQGATTKRKPMGSLGWHTSLSSQGGKRMPGHTILPQKFSVVKFVPYHSFGPVQLRHEFGPCGNGGSPLRCKAQEVWRSPLAEQWGK